MPWVNQLSKISRKRGRLWAWTVALGLYVAAIAVRGALSPLLDAMKFLTFYPAVVIATLICGPWQGAAVLFLSLLYAWYFLFEPVQSFVLKDAPEVAALTGFSVVGGFFVCLVALLREAVRRLDIARRAQEILFSELQHRVANNLQLVVSLLREAQRSLRNPVLAAEILNDAEERIIAMSQLHRRLQDGTAFAYGLQPLLREVLTNAFRNLPVKIQVNVDDVSNLSIDQMTAITLLVNEAAINATKHVFSRGLGKCFNVCLVRDADNVIRLAISDDGPGLQTETSGLGDVSLGMGLMEAFAAQLGGSLEVAKGGGMSLSVKLAPAS